MEIIDVVWFSQGPPDKETVQICAVLTFDERMGTAQAYIGTRSGLPASRFREEREAAMTYPEPGEPVSPWGGPISPSGEELEDAQHVAQWGAKLEPRLARALFPDTAAGVRFKNEPPLLGTSKGIIVGWLRDNGAPERLIDLVRDL